MGRMMGFHKGKQRVHPPRADAPFVCVSKVAMPLLMIETTRASALIIPDVEGVCSRADPTRTTPIESPEPPQCSGTSVWSSVEGVYNILRTKYGRTTG